MIDVHLAKKNFMLRSFIALVLFSCISLVSFAQEENDRAGQTTDNKIIFSSSGDATMYQWGLLEKGSKTYTNSLRVAMFFNAGIQANKSFSDNFGAKLGIGVHNLGFAHRQDSFTTKSRVYSIQIPLFLRFGTLEGAHFIAGGGIDLPFHYKEKWYVEKKDKQKISEWFSKRNAAIMPFGSVGYKFKKGLSLRLDYYFSNFFNPNFTNANNLQPYKYVKENLIVLSLGNIHLFKDKINLKDLKIPHKEN